MRGNLEYGYRVRALDDLSTGKQKNIELFIDNPGYEFVKGDIKDHDICMKACVGVVMFSIKLLGDLFPALLKCRYSIL